MTGTVRASGRPRLGEVFDPRANGLNLVRLLLAVGVIYRHSDVLLGLEPTWAWARALQRGAFVDAFFAVSGFLIVSSWIARPDWRRFLRARVLRIFPAFLVCLVATAAVFAPLYATLVGRSTDALFWRSAGGYVVHNAALWINQTGIAGTPTLSALPGEWNGSLWTLSWEFICYLGVLALGLLGLWRRRWVVGTLFVTASAALALTASDVLPGYLAHHAARFAVMFLAGALLYVLRDRLPLTPALLAAAAAVVVLCAAALPDYRVVGAFPLAYLVVGIGALARNPRLHLRNDVSYGTYIYAYPVQQLTLAVAGTSLSVPVFFAISTAATLPLAAGSWFLVERTALRHKDRPLLRRPVGRRALRQSAVPETDTSASR